MTEKQVARFWGKVDKSSSPNGCWIWRGGVSPKGYGVFSVCKDAKNVTHRAHRLSFAMAFGTIKKGQFVCHNCPGRDNPACVNPAHLWVGTHLDNMSDAVKKSQMATGGRHGSKTHPERLKRGDEHYSRTHPERLNPQRGENHHSRRNPGNMPRGELHYRAILNESKVKDIRDSCASGISQSKIAKNHGVSPSLISNIVSGKIWKQVTPGLPGTGELT